MVSWYRFNLFLPYSTDLFCLFMYYRTVCLYKIYVIVYTTLKNCLTWPGKGCRITVSRVCCFWRGSQALQELPPVFGRVFFVLLRPLLERGSVIGDRELAWGSPQPAYTVAGSNGLLSFAVRLKANFCFTFFVRYVGNMAGLSFGSPGQRMRSLYRFFCNGAQQCQ